MATSEAQKRAVRKYEKKLKRIPFLVDKEFYDLIKKNADKCEYSVSGFIRVAVSAFIEVCERG